MCIFQDVVGECARFAKYVSKYVSISIKSVIAAALLQLGPLGVFGIANAQGSFSVEDSIELTRFSDPNPRAHEVKLNTSPDRRRLAIVTTRGVIASDELESRLLIFDLSGLGVEGGPRESDPFQPIRSVTVSGRTQIRHGGYGSLITSVVWGGRSDTVYYLAETDAGRRDLYRLNVDSDREPERISDGRSSVASFGARSGSLVFTAIPPYVERLGVPGSRQINASAYDITGVSMGQVIVPEQWDRIEQANPDWYALNAGGAPSSVRPLAGAGIHPAKVTELLDPAISPDGGHAIVLATAPASPAEWQTYERAPGAALSAGPATEEEVRSDHRWPAIYAIADLEQGTVEPLVNAPIGALVGYMDSVIASWSEDGGRVAITNVYRPLQANLDHETQDRRPCAVAVVEVADREFSCLLESRSGIGDDPDAYVRGIRFSGQTQLEVSVSSDGETTKWVYEREDGQWREASTVSTPSEQEPAEFDIVLKQDFNVPPALWLRRTGEPDRLLWTPTPDLDLSESAVAREFAWSDSTGHRWRGTLLTPDGHQHGVRYPLIVQTHGNYRPNDFFTDGVYTSGYAGRPLADAGFVVLQMHNRPETWLSDQEVSAFQAGLDAAIAELVRMELVDAERVGLIGFSRTAYHVQSVLVRSPDRYAVAAITDGVDQSYMQAMLWNIVEGDVIYGSMPFGAGLQQWVEEAPSFNLHRMNAPLMVTAITLGSILMEWEIYASLTMQGKPVSFLYIPDDQHVLQNPLARLASQGSTFDWFRFWLQGYEDPDQEKADRYASWRMMRDEQCARLEGNAIEPWYCRQ